MTLLSSRTALLSLALLTSVGGGVYGIASCGGNTDNGSGDDASVDVDAQPMMDSSGPTCDANLQNDPHHCGKCTTACSTGQLCNAGTCMNQCTSPKVVCSGVMGCVDLGTDLDHCGDCNRKCNAPEGGIPVPDGGASEAGPEGGGGDAAADAADAGDAGDDGGDDGGPVDDGQRIATAECTMGKCDYTCPTAPNVAKCGTDGCFDLTLSPTHCGSCTTQCSGNCQQGVCCDQPSLVCGGVCTDVTSDPNNCGKCGNLCNITGESCQMGACVCPMGQGACNGTCSDVTKDPNNCGKCGNQCHNGQTCGNGHCGGYTVTSPSPQAFIDACTVAGHQTILVSDQNDDYAPATNFPFAFQYYGGTPAQYYVGTDGTIGIDFNPGFGSPGCTPLTFDQAFVEPFGDTIQTQAGGVCVATQGVSPNQQMIVTWKDVQIEFDATSDGLFSVVFTQTSNTIDFIYSKMVGTWAQGSLAGIGMQNGDGSIFTSLSCDTAYINSTPFSVRLTPIP
jgi:hypothetical protein